MTVLKKKILARIIEIIPKRKLRATMHFLEVI